MSHPPCSSHISLPTEARTDLVFVFVFFFPFLNDFFFLYTYLQLCTPNPSLTEEEERCHANDTFLFLLFEGQFKLSSRSRAGISDAEMCA